MTSDRLTAARHHSASPGDSPRAVALPPGIEAVIFDMDGVITDTASVHAQAWKQLFDDYLRERSRRAGESFKPFEIEADYRPYVDGKPRYDGVRDFLASRGIRLPEGAVDDGPEAETVHGLGNRKNQVFLERLHDAGAQAFETSIELLHALRDRGVPVAVISASRNMAEVLTAAGLDGLFDARVDGVIAARLQLPGKPDPAVFLEAARRLKAQPGHCAVVEDAIAGVEAGRAGGFGQVVGVDRSAQVEALLAAGADLVVTDLAELWQAPSGGRREAPGGRPSIAALPLVRHRLGEIHDRLEGRRVAVFLDYDGTLTPIVDDPDAALLAPATREAIRRLAERTVVAIVSGRDLDDVRGLVDLDGIWYAGSHGFELVGPDGAREERATESLPALRDAEAELHEAIDAIEGARIERKRFAIAIHFRNSPRELVPDIEAGVRAVAEGHPGLRISGGKKILELRPDIDWDKGRALDWLFGELGLAAGRDVPIYIGDDETDEDAFRALAGLGIGFVVRGEADERPTWAAYALADPDEVRDLIERLAAWAASAPRNMPAPRNTPA